MRFAVHFIIGLARQSLGQLHFSYVTNFDCELSESRTILLCDFLLKMVCHGLISTRGQQKTIFIAK